MHSLLHTSIRKFSHHDCAIHQHANSHDKSKQHNDIDRQTENGQ
ncbi:Uncharacterised protein [Vibrio cholerae]|nr:Uncharacterised protein [Vibrio cholerae]